VAERDLAADLALAQRLAAQPALLLALLDRPAFYARGMAALLEPGLDDRQRSLALVLLPILDVADRDHEWVALGRLRHRVDLVHRISLRRVGLVEGRDDRRAIGMRGTGQRGEQRCRGSKRQNRIHGCVLFRMSISSLFTGASIRHAG